MFGKILFIDLHLACQLPLRLKVCAMQARPPAVIGAKRGVDAKCAFVERETRKPHKTRDCNKRQDGKYHGAPVANFLQQCTNHVTACNGQQKNPFPARPCGKPRKHGDRRRPLPRVPDPPPFKSTKSQGHEQIEKMLAERGERQQYKCR